MPNTLKQTEDTRRILPAYPLWVIDPMFSVWSKSDTLNGADTIFWTGQNHNAYGFVRYNGKTYCFLGRNDNAISLRQTKVEISAFATHYRFEAEEFALEVSFVSPLDPEDLKLLSCPVCYTEYEIQPKGALPEDFSIALALDENFCYNTERAPLFGGVLPCEKYEAAYFTRQRNLVLSNTEDTVAPDWGATYLAGEESFFFTEVGLNRYLLEGVAEYLRNDNERKYIFAMNRKAKGFFMTAFDDYVSIFYFGQWLKGYFFKDGGTIVDAMNWSFDNYAAILEQCEAFDRKLRSDCEQVGKDYYTLACAAMRQCIGAHKLVENREGQLLMLSKECDSNGCIGTVDVSYPSMPLFLIYNPQLVNALMAGIFTFARMDVWTYDFAPHDLGTYPWCAGQVYGTNLEDDKYGCGMNNQEGSDCTKQMLYIRPAKSNTYGLKNQMPVEECGNMLIMTAAAIGAGADKSLAQQNFDQLQTWVGYLERHGLRPENQLCTDDFAGHLANNINLAIKALVGIESFSLICAALGKADLAQAYLEKAKAFAAELKRTSGANDGVMPLAYDSDKDFSLKYNILFDKLFGFELMGQEICERETDCYIARNNRFGVPLDPRADYTKSDWILWTAALTDSREKAEALFTPVLTYLKETPSRLPFGDWYDTKKGNILYFYNRTVQGGIFAPLLKKKVSFFK